MKIDGRSVYLFDVPGDGFTTFDLRDARCRTLTIGNRPHPPQPLPYPAEGNVDRATWIAHLREAMRRPVAMHDTPVVTDYPAAVKRKIAAFVKKHGHDEYGPIRIDVEVHHVRMEGRDSWLVYYGFDDAVSEVMYERNGSELDVGF